MADNDGTVDVDGHAIRVTNLDKVLYPADRHHEGARSCSYYVGARRAIAPLLRDAARHSQAVADGVDRDAVLREEPPGRHA